ncbi:DUF6233 domain-containing protein [Streptomyces sp. NPDC093228]
MVGEYPQPTTHPSSHPVRPRAQAIDALRRQVPACTHCRPDTELGVLD